MRKPTEAPDPPSRRSRHPEPDSVSSRRSPSSSCCLLPVAIVSWIIAYRSLQENLSREFTDKGSAIANSLSSSAADLVVNRDASTVQAQVDEFAKISGVAYVMVYDPQRALIAHTFARWVPKGIIEMNVVPGQTTKPQVRELTYLDPRGGASERSSTSACPCWAAAGDRAGGHGQSIITTAAVGPATSCSRSSVGSRRSRVLAGVIFAQRITRPVNALMSVASAWAGRPLQLVPVTSRDEIGQMASPSTNPSCASARWSRPRPIATTSAASARSCSRTSSSSWTRWWRSARATSPGAASELDVLGNVVDAINLMVEEISSIVGDVRQAPSEWPRVRRIPSDHRRARGGGAGSDPRRGERDPLGGDVTVSVRQVADSADQSAKAARQVLQAASKGESAVRNSLASMQADPSRGADHLQEDQVPRRSLARNLHIVNTIQDIAAQTHSSP